MVSQEQIETVTKHGLTTILGRESRKGSAGCLWWYVYTVKSYEEKSRFGKPNLLLEVDVSTTLDVSNVHETTKRWLDQLI